MKKLMVVDDERDIVDLLQHEFTSEGYSVAVAGNGYEAILKALDTQFDLILIDMVMPKLNGVETIRILRKIYPNLPIVAFTGHVGQGYMSETMSLGVIDCVKKPFKLDYLREVIKNAIDKAASTTV